MRTQNVTIKITIDKLDFIKITICSSKDTFKKMNRQAMDCEKIFVIHRPDIHIYVFVTHGSGFVSRIYIKNFYKSIKKNKKPNIQKCVKDLNRHLTKEDT